MFEALESRKLLTLTIADVTSYSDYRLMDLGTYIKGANLTTFQHYVIQIKSVTLQVN